MKKRYLLLIIPVIIIAMVLILNKKTKNITIKEANYDSAYSKLAINILKNKANSESITNYEDGNKGEMYAFHHENTYHVSARTDYRYSGINPNNYAYFNCSDITDTSTCEIWRIVGIIPDSYKINNEWKHGYEAIKIIKDEYIGQFAYDTNGTTDWGRSTLKDYLNNDYYNSLTDSAKEMILETVYYLSPIGYEELVPHEEFYKRERAYYSNNLNNEYSNYYRTWYGKIALPYPSDYYYSHSWMHSPGNMSLLNREEFAPNGNLHYIINDFETFSNSSPTVENNIKPVAYLNNDIFVLSGNGTSENPYLFGTKEDLENMEYEYKIGDEIYYNNELYYVIENSLNESDYVAVLKDVPLKEKYTNINNDDNLNLIGNIPFDYSDTCYYKNRFQNDYSGCTNNYNLSFIKSLLDKWANDEFSEDDLIEVDGNKARLITKDEILNTFLFEQKVVPYGTSTIMANGISDNNPDFIKNRSYNCWTMDKYEDSNNVINFKVAFSYGSPYNSACVEPVINFKKSSIGDKNEYQQGEIINYKDADYYVINVSLSNIDYVTVLKTEPLTKKELKKYYSKVDTSNNIGKSIYMKNDNNLSISYENSQVRKVIDSWLDKTFDDNDLAIVNGLRARLISFDELIESMGFDYRYYSIGSSHYKELYKTDETPEWIYNYSFWTETSKEDNGTSIFAITNYGAILTDYIENNNMVRPIVYLNKSAIGKVSSKYKEDNEEINDSNYKNNNNNNKQESVCTPKYKTEIVTHYNTYNVGDEINYKGDKYYVISNSDNQSNYVTILKDEVFKNKDYKDSIDDSIKYYFTKDYSIHDYNYTERTPYDNSELCQSGNISQCKNDYNSSSVKKIVDNWSKIEFNDNDLVNVDGYEARLLSKKDLQNLGYSFINDSGREKIVGDRSLYPWIFSSQDSFWGMSESINNPYNVFSIIKNYDIAENGVYNNAYVKPIINLKKSVLGSKVDYNVGEEVIYNNEKYNVLENSDSSKDYIVLLKQIPLMLKQLYNYKNLDYDEFYNEFLEYPYNVKYYVSENCMNNSNNNDCKNDYDNSNVKKIIDEWIEEKDIEKDLIEINGYKARLLNMEDLFDNLNYTDQRYSSSYFYKEIYVTNVNVPKWISNPNAIYWTMIDYNNNTSRIYVILDNGYFGVNGLDLSSEAPINVYDRYAIRPVLNLNKCAIEGGCTTEEIEIEDGCMEDGVTILDNIANTLSSVSKYIIILSVIAILIGLSIFGYNYYKSRKERK